MNKRILTFGAIALLSTINYVSAQEKNDEKAKQEQNQGKTIGKDYPTLVLNGADDKRVISVSLKDLDPNQDVTIVTPAGFSVNPSRIPAGTKDAKITLSLLSSKKKTEGVLAFRSGDKRTFINLIGKAENLPTKDLSTSPVYKGNDKSFLKKAVEGFKPTEKGYTVEFKVKSKDVGSEFFPYVVNGKGIGFKAFVNGDGTGLYSSKSEKGLSNRSTQFEGGLGKFYNTDDKFHVYRYAVAPDNRIFVYRDGLAIDTVRALDLGPQENFASGIGEPVENLLKNPGFEGEFDVVSATDKIATKIEGWDVVVGDRWNSQQFIIPAEIDNEQDFTNHVLKMERYMWADGWSAAEIAQVVDVAPNESYTLQALVRGGIKKEGDLLGKIKIQEVQDQSIGASVDVTGATWETYSLDYTTSANCKQIRVLFYLERDKWGAHITPMEIDNVKLTGRARTYEPKIGFDNDGSELAYFTYDLSGAYAPSKVPEINVVLDGSK
ncbi:hypothetical protein [Sphingobacterium siyangense]|uniref:hypothetical protein n=1 Tax=Sphingobacterium siyangense TaxID=459529 RepID=UPI003C73CA68